jgi:hypothetical protein
VLADFALVWNELFSTEQARIVQLLDRNGEVDRVARLRIYSAK